MSERKKKYNISYMENNRKKTYYVLILNFLKNKVVKLKDQNQN